MALTAVLVAAVGGMAIQALLAFVIGMAGAASKPAFDALVQRYVPTAAQGRAFARFETRLQLVWVLGAFLPVVVSLPLIVGRHRDRRGGGGRRVVLHDRPTRPAPPLGGPLSGMSARPSVRRR